ncbi:MAG: hypothetical protein K6T75_08135 [Acetobacteraceae bacterium]|nr:hypothetical protein [Acetobacteraceae bacterium]
MGLVVHLRLLFLHGTAEQQANPALRGRPVLVFQGGRVRGLSREAAARGVRVGARLSHARHACRDAAFLPYEPERCRRFATPAWDACALRSPRVEPVGDDEVFLDLSGPSEGGPERVAGLCREIEARLGIWVAAGCAASRLAARVASGLAAEAPGGRGGTVWVEEGREASFLEPLGVEWLWPLDAAVVERLRRLGLSRVGAVARVPRRELCRQFGLLGAKVSDLSRGLDPSPVLALYPPARLAFRVALEGEAQDSDRLERALDLLAARIASALDKRQEACRHLVLRLSSDWGEDWEGSRRFLHPRREAPALAAALRALLDQGLAALAAACGGGTPVEVLAPGAGLGRGEGTVGPGAGGDLPLAAAARGAAPGTAALDSGGVPVVEAIEAEARDLLPAAWGQPPLPLLAGGGRRPAAGGGVAAGVGVSAAGPARVERLTGLMEALEKRYCSRVLTVGWQARGGEAAGRRELLLGMVDPFRGAGAAGGGRP